MQPWKSLARQAVGELREHAQNLGEWAWFELNSSIPINVQIDNRTQRATLSFAVKVMPMNVYLPAWTFTDLSADTPISKANIKNIWRQIGHNYFSFMSNRILRNHNFADNVNLFVEHAEGSDDVLDFAQHMYPVALDWWRAVATSKFIDKLNLAYHQTRIRHTHRRKN